MSQGGKMNPQNVIIIGDFLKDLDDEHSLLLAAKLHRDGLINLKCVIANLKPALLRARGAKGTLKLLGLRDIPVGVGRAVYEQEIYPYEDDIPYLADSFEVISDGAVLLKQTLRHAQDKSLTLVLQSGFTDATALFSSSSSLCAKKIAQVVIMGGVEAGSEKIKLDHRGFMIPNNANNNVFDWDATLQLYNKLQNIAIPTVITTREAAYACKFPLSMNKMMADTGNPIGSCLKSRQESVLHYMWKAACSPAGSQTRGTIPIDRDRDWFIRVYCDGLGPFADEDKDIRPFLKTFNLYDPINLVAAIPVLRKRFFRPTEVKINSTTHLVIGVSAENHGVRDPQALRDFIIENEIAALRN